MNQQKSDNSNKPTLRKGKILDQFAKEERAVNQARISNALSTNLAARKQPTLFDCLDEKEKNAIQESDKAHYVDRKGKRISLSVEQIKLVKFISSCIPLTDDNVEAQIAMINTMNAKGELDSDGKASPVQIVISMVDACKQIIGTTKENDLKTMEKRLVNLSQIEQVQTFKIGKEEYKVVRPLIMLNEKLYKNYSEIRSNRGMKKNTTEEDNCVLIGANVYISAIFLHQVQNKYCPFYGDRYFRISKKNKTELWQILLSDLESKWRQFYISCSRAESQYKKNNKELLSTNKEEYYKGLGLARKNALTYKCSLVTLRDRVTTDYESQRAYRAKYLKDIQKALASCIEYGIITDKSHVSTDKQNLILVYNPNFNDTQIEEVEAEEV